MFLTARYLAILAACGSCLKLIRVGKAEKLTIFQASRQKIHHGSFACVFGTPGLCGGSAKCFAQTFKYI